MPSANPVRRLLILAGIALLAGAPATQASISMKFPRFSVPPHSDREVCTFVRLPRKATYMSGGFQIVNVGVGPEFVSHHFLMYTYNGTDMNKFPPKGQIVDSKACLDFGPGDTNQRTLIGGSQSPKSRQLLPKGLAQQLTPPAAGEPIGVILNSHWINSSDQTQFAAVKIKIFPAKRGIKRIMKPIFDVVANEGIDVAPMTESTTRGSWRVGGPDFGGAIGGAAIPKTPICAVSLSSHMHKRGKLFAVQLVQNRKTTDLFSTTTYTDPPINVFDGKNGRPAPILLNKGDGFNYACTQANGVDGTDLKLGCQETDGPTPGKVPFPNGIHAAAKQCHTAGDDPSECPATDPAYVGRTFTGKCVPANLVFGFTSDDEMCILPGAYFDTNPSAPAGQQCDLALMPLLK